MAELISKVDPHMLHSWSNSHSGLTKEKMSTVSVTTLLTIREKR